MNNFTKRIIIAVIAAPLILYSPFAGMNFFTAFIFLISFIGSKEIISFYRSRHLILNPIMPYLASITPFIFLVYGFESAALYGVSLSLVLFVIEVFRSREKASYIASAYVFIFVYCGLFPSMLIGVVADFGPWIFIFIYSVIIATDSFAYFGGILCGKLFRTHKLLKKISPNKTIEGAFSGLLFAVITGWFVASNTILRDLLFGYRPFALAAIISICGQIGDLFESMLKRDFKIKDSSNIIPGHGGILDRFDSLIFVSPAVYIYLIYFI